MKLEIGYNHSFEIRETILELPSIKPFSVIFLSDLHFNGFSKKICAQLIETINKLRPDLILLGGDYVDTNTGFYFFQQLLSALSLYCPNVFAIAGNHDYLFGINKIQNLIDKERIGWIEQKSIRVNINGCCIKLDGNKIFPSLAEDAVSILCMHKPLPFKKLHTQYQLAFAGHLHGCQFVLWENENGLYPGRYFYVNNIRETRNERSVYLISKGLGDTLPLRYNCKKDILFVNCIPQKS